MLASFEKTADHLFDAAYFGQKDSVCGKGPFFFFARFVNLITTHHLPPSHLRCVRVHNNGNPDEYRNRTLQTLAQGGQGPLSSEKTSSL